MLEKRIQKLEEAIEYVFDDLSDQELELFVDLAGRENELSRAKLKKLKELHKKVKIRLPDGRVIPVPVLER